MGTSSSPVARDHWGKIELIIRESGDEGGDALHARSHHLSRALLACLACSRVPQFPLTLGEACGGGRVWEDTQRECPNTVIGFKPTVSNLI